MIEFELVFEGGRADEGLLEFYDAARALAGFQRSLALTTHLAINGEIITQAPSATGFEIFVPPPIRGSWKTVALIVFSSSITISAAGKDSPLGQIVTSLYDAALYNTMGFHVDYTKTLQQQYSEHFEHNDITEEKIDSLCEKIESSVADMHRPIVISKSANSGIVRRCGRDKLEVGPYLSVETYNYVRQSTLSDDIEVIQGYVSSYNINTFKGRLFSLVEHRPISFELDDRAKDSRTVGALTTSQHLNGQKRNDPQALVEFHCRRIVSANNKTKRYLVLSARLIAR